MAVIEQAIIVTVGINAIKWTDINVLNVDFEPDFYDLI